MTPSLSTRWPKACRSRSWLACAGLDGETPQAVAGFFDRHNRADGQGIAAFTEHLQESRCDGARCLIVESEKNHAR
jgi:hypothetical protein